MTRQTDQEILRRLTEAEQEYGRLLKPVELYSKLLRLQIDSQIGLAPQGLAEGIARQRLEEGKSILSLEDMVTDWSLVSQMLRAVVGTVAEYIPKNPDSAGGIEQITSSTFPLRQTVADWYDNSSLAAIALTHGISEELLSSVIAATLQPLLKPLSEDLIKLVDQRQWRRHYCPICAGRSDFAYLDKESGARWLMCSRCDTDWLFQRLECPYCSNTDQKSLAYFTNEDALYRLYVCKKCHSYIKAIDLRKTEPDTLLPLERIVTNIMDQQAREKGYSKPVFGIIPFEELEGLC